MAKKTTKRIDKCPLCGGSLQATRTEYMNNLVINSDGDCLDDGDWVGTDEMPIYCSGGHTMEQIIEAAKKGSAAD